MTREEKSLLLYLETRVVDHGGLVDISHMNSDDMEIAKRWNEEGFLRFGRVVFKDAERLSSGHRKLTHWASLTPDSFEAAHMERKLRAQRMWNNRTWETTEEK